MLAALTFAQPSLLVALLALPVLWPSLFGTTSLLFANAFGGCRTVCRTLSATRDIQPPE